MARPRLLSDHQLIAARWEYEATPITERNLAAKFGVARSTIRGWIVKQRWAKAPRLRGYHGEEGQKEFQCDVRVAVKDAFNRKIICALEQTLLLPPAGNPTKLGQSDQVRGSGIAGIDGFWELLADRPAEPKLPPVTPPPKSALASKKAEPEGTVVRLPGVCLPPPMSERDIPGFRPGRTPTLPPFGRIWRHCAAR
jgi:hypothetical protein